MDSLLAAKILMEQGFDVTGFYCILPFTADDFVPEDSPPALLAEKIGLPLVFYRCGQEYLDMVKAPEHGYGANMNPCIDCKIHFMKKAGAYMKESGALFVATGEVVGQRPMSQLKHIMNHILKASNLEGRLLRPLSAKLLKPTIMEEQGIVDRDKLFGIQGRGRKPQMELAAKYGITEYASPAGGCLFTDPNVSARLRDLFAHHKDCSVTDTYLLTIGRHFRLDNGSKLIVARNESEGKKLAFYKDSSPFYFEPSFKGPSALVRGEPESDIVPLAASIICRYGRPDEKNNTIAVSRLDTLVSINANERAGEELLNKLKIN
ncbi:MAG: hypothetical protein FWG13_05755 [Leptospirales bacterium]|nr:hypothetical protein [Leptospirales bacterium]